MTHLIVLAKVVVLLALVSVVPFWLIIKLEVPPLYAVLGSVAVAILLASVWMGGKR